MIRQLPEGSRFGAAMAYDRSKEIDEIKPTERDKAIADLRTWTLDRKLVGMIINAINNQTVLSNQWEGGKPPQFPVVGPESWQPEEAAPQEPQNNFDVLKRMGWPGGG